MGWELRHGDKWYLYRNRRVNGKPVKEYLAAENDRFGFGDLMAHGLRRLQTRHGKLGGLGRKQRAERREKIDGLLAAGASANAELRTVAEGVLYAIGYHRHHRGEWRMRRELSLPKDAIEELKKQAGGPNPLVRYEPATDDAEAVEVFAWARAGECDAQAKVHAMIRDRKWADWLGDLGKEATHQLIHRAAGGDPVWKEGIIQKANALRRELLGDKPTVLEELLVRRVVNGWVTVHALELVLTVRPPANPRDRAYLDTALTRAQRRMTEAIGELARVRRLQAPKILAQLNVATAQTVVNAGAGVGEDKRGDSSRRGYRIGTTDAARLKNQG